MLPIIGIVIKLVLWFYLVLKLRIVTSGGDSDLPNSKTFLSQT